MEYVTLIVDGQEVQVEKGKTIMDAARKLGIYIPCLCSHPDLKPIGLCKLSVVKIKGWDTYPLATIIPAEDGMVVTTKTNELQEMRRNALEMILAMTNHPTNCLFCDRKDECTSLRECMEKFPVTAGCKYCPKDGECEIQDAVEYVGLEKVRYTTVYRDLPVLREPFFDRNYNLCILCTRCVRTCEEVRGENTIVYHPGFHENHWVGPENGVSLLEGSCKFCGACVDACPTGALSARFEKWEKPEKTVTTCCSYCGIGCQIDVGLKDGHIVRTRGKKGNTVNEGQLCVKSRFGLDFASHPDRLKEPLIRKDGELKPASWDEAIDLVASKFKELKEKYGSDALAGIASSKTTNEECYLSQKFIRVCLSTNNIEFCTRFCHTTSAVALSRAFGGGAMSNSTRGVEESDVVFIAGLNATENTVIFGAYLRNLVKTNNLKLIVMDPRRIDLVGDAEIWLRPKPGTDLALVNAMMNVIINEDLCDREFVESRTEGFDKLKEMVSKYTPEKAEEITGVSKDKIIESARLYGKANKAGIMYGMGIAQYTNGTNNISALCNLALLTGNMGKEGTGVNTIGKQNNGQGAGDMGCLCAIYPGGQPVAKPEVNEKFEKAWGTKLSMKPGTTETEWVTEKGKIKGLYVIGGNPVGSGPNLNNLKEVLGDMDFIVVQDIFLTETAKMADVVLPAACLLEKDGTATSTERRINRVRKVLDAPGQARSDWEIICDLGKRMGYSAQFSYNSPSEIMDEIAKLTPPYGGINYERLEEGGIQAPCPNVDHPGTPYLYKDKFPIGKGKFFPADYEPPSELPNDEYPFIFSTGSSIFHMRTGTMIEKVHDINYISGSELLHMNPEDAFSLGIRDNDTVEVSSRRGSLKLKTKIVDNLLKGVVFTTFHFADAPTNILTNDKYDPLGKVPELKFCAVKVNKIGGQDV